MDFEEFVETLYKIGWRADGDAQHTQIRELWDLLIERGLLVHKGGLTKRAADKCPRCGGIRRTVMSDPAEDCPACHGTGIRR